MTGVYISRGKTTEEVRAERRAKETCDAMPVEVTMPYGLVDTAPDVMRDENDMLIDIIMALDFFVEVLRDDGAASKLSPHIAAALDLMLLGIKAGNDAREVTLRSVEDAIRAALSKQRQAQHDKAFADEVAKELGRC